jgi:DHA1 family inner membrane transport protein
VLVLCAGLFAIPVVALSLARPPAPLQPAAVGGERTGEPAARLGALVLAVTVLASGCFLAVTYVVPIAEWLQQDAGGLSVAAAMLAFGIGMNLGNFGCGRIADRSADAALLGSGAAGAVGAAALCIPAGGAVSVGAGMLLVGIGLGGVSPAAQVLYVRIAARFPKFAASLASGTVNLGSFAGASLGAGALGWLGIAWVPMTALMLFGIGIALQLGRMLGRGRTAELSAATARARAARRRDPADTPTGSP